MVEHAYAGRAGPIEVGLRLSGSRVAVEVHDLGCAMPKGRLPSGQRPMPDELQEGGYGWFLIQSLTQQLDYSRQPPRNVLRFELALGTGDGEGDGGPDG